MTELSSVNHQKAESPMTHALSDLTTQDQWSVAESSYKASEQRANWYFSQLASRSRSDDFLLRLGQDYQDWNRQQKKQGSSVRLSELEQLQSSHQINSLSFLQKLDAEQQLAQYLEKSIAYIFLRDLGHSLTDKKTQQHIKRSVRQIQKWVRRQVNNSQAVESELLIVSKAQEYNLQHRLFWLQQKLATIKQYMPSSMDSTHGLRKLVKIIAGVTLHNVINQPDLINDEQLSAILDRSIQLGYCYGLTYPFIDDIQDSADLLSPEDKDLFNQAIRNSLLTGKVAPCPTFSGKHSRFLEFVYHELKNAFETIRAELSEQEAKLFFEQSFVFFEAQNIDRSRSFDQLPYTNEQLFVPIILKASGCRLIARAILGQHESSSFEHHTFCFGIYNQFNDDIKDIFDDLAEGNVTPYTHFLKLKGQGNCSSVENPYRIYWSVVDYLIREVYKDHPQTKALLLERSINAHKSLRSLVGEEKYKALQNDLLHTGDTEFDQLIDQLVRQPNDVAWFDKLISRHIANHFIKRQKQNDNFQTIYEDIKQRIEPKLPIAHRKLSRPNQLIDAANYSLNAGGKRLRPVLAFYVANTYYQLNEAQSISIARLLEYMHTASLIFDDKPTQDNADFRRGKPTLHKQLNCEATAELAAVSLIMKAVEVQSELQGINPAYVLKSLSYAAQVTQAICEGQILDLKSSNTAIDLPQLEHLTFLKTGLAIEAALVIPAILAGENDIQINHLKKFARELGMAFQIKDDLLDVKGQAEQLGKPVKQDNNKASFVTMLGIEQSERRLAEHYFAALKQLEFFPEIRQFLRQILDYAVMRSF